LAQTTSGATTLNQTRTHTQANETTAIGATVGTDWADPVLDRDGNMTRVPKPATPNQLWRLTYDAWNRLVQVVDDISPNPVIAKHKYDGLHRRIVKLKPNGANWDRRDYYYSCEWQVVEERELLSTASQTTVATLPKFQWLWDIRYIDAVLLRDENKDGDGDCVDGTDQRLYYAQDANFNVTALLNTAGTVVERVLYDAYGKSTLWNAAWSATQSSTLYNNEVLYAGYRLDPESGLYQVRHRNYHPTLGRWVQRDPIGYQDGMNLYEYVKSGPFTYTDPYGLNCCCLIIVLQYDPDKGTSKIASNKQLMDSAEALKGDGEYKKNCEKIVIVDLGVVDGLKGKIESVDAQCAQGIKRITIIGHGGSETGVGWPAGKNKKPVATDAKAVAEAFKSDKAKGTVLLDIDLYTCYSMGTAELLAKTLEFPNAITILGDEGETKGINAKGKTTPPTPEKPKSVKSRPLTPTNVPGPGANPK
jgi:RHS repeat-associated protein